MIVIIDYGMGNIGSIVNMIKKAGGESRVSGLHEEIEAAQKLILPGVGAFDHGMKNLEELGLKELLTRKVLDEKVPILGVCLGMQLFTASSEEGSLPGLGWVDAKCCRFRFSEEKKLRIPHMGWNTVEIRKQSPLFSNMYEEAAFYFVHSYHVVCHQESDVLTSTSYGYPFVSSLQHENIFATQFHPEKSHKYGLQIMKNFVAL